MKGRIWDAAFAPDGKTFVAVSSLNGKGQIHLFKSEYDATISPELKKLFETARRHKVGAGIHYWEGIDKEVEWSKAGGNLIMHSADVTLFQKQLKADMNELRTKLGDDRGTGTGDSVIV